MGSLICTTALQTDRKSQNTRFPGPGAAAWPQMLARLRIGLISNCQAGKQTFVNDSCRRCVRPERECQDKPSSRAPLPLQRTYHPSSESRMGILCSCIQIAGEVCSSPMFLWPVVLCPRCNGPPSDLGKHASHHSPHADRQAPREALLGPTRGLGNSARVIVCGSGSQ